MILWLSTIHLLLYIFLAFWLGFGAAVWIMWPRARHEHRR